MNYFTFAFLAGLLLAVAPQNTAAQTNEAAPAQPLSATANDPANTAPSGGFKGVARTLFQRDLLTDIEFNLGAQQAQIDYWGTDYDATALLAGIRTVEQFDRTWEASWDLSGSWAQIASRTAADEIAPTQKGGLRPLLFNGHFAVQYNPAIGRAGADGTLRLITSLGLESGIYAPRHFNKDIPWTEQNVGFTTGWGPRLGAGLAVRTGTLTLYALGTGAAGDIFKRDYHYSSIGVEAGVRFRNLASLRLEINHSKWGPDVKKQARRYDFALGLPLQALLN